VNGAIVGGLVTGGFALIVLFATLRHDTRLAGRAEAERTRVRRAERLRDAYRDFVAAAYTMQGQAALLPIALIESQRGRPSFFNDLMEKWQSDAGKQNAGLMLEDDPDQAVMAKFGELSNEHSSFLLAVMGYLNKNQLMPNDEYLRRVTSMCGKADDIRQLARSRLAELEGEW
jgi:hypothetical protein